MSRVLLVVGVRGPGLAEAIGSLRSRGEVVLAALDSVLSHRLDAAAATDVVTLTAPTQEQLMGVVAAESRQRSFDGVLTLADDMVVFTAHLASRLGLRGIHPDRVHLFRDKVAQRAALAAAGLTVPAFASSRPSGDAAEVPLPAVVKPARGSGGALAFVVTEEDQLGPVLSECIQRSHQVSAVDDGSPFIIEQVIQGSRWHEADGFAPYVSVESAALDGQVWHLAVTDRFPLLPPVLETGMCLPSSLAPVQQKEVISVVDHALSALDFDQGLSHTEVMLTAEGPVVIEVNARAGGALPYLFPLAGGPDLTALAADLARGVPPEIPCLEGHAVFVALQHPLGVDVLEVGGLDVIRDLPGIRTVVQLSGSGHSTESLEDTMAALALGWVATVEEAVQLHAACYAAFTCRYAGAETPEHYRRTPDGVVHPLILG